MKCLIDADILAYEISACGEYKDEETGEKVIRDFQFVADLLDQRIKEIEGECWATEPSTLYLTGDERLIKSLNRKRRRIGEEEILYKDNFRKEIAKAKPYKGTRKAEKPFHFHNLREYMLEWYDTQVANGLEADDLIAIELTKTGDKLDTICCTRDKDLRQVPGMHFGWPCGKQPQYGPRRVTQEEGWRNFWYQMIVGDVVDNIPGLPGGGPALANKVLVDGLSHEDMFHLVYKLYEDKLKKGEDDYGWNSYFYEQAGLLWMVRDLFFDDTPVSFQDDFSYYLRDKYADEVQPDEV